MSKIKITMPESDVVLGKNISFVAPCACADVTGLIINNIEYSVVDALGNIVTGNNKVWSDGAILSVILDTVNARAFLLNASNEHGHSNYYSSTTPRTANSVLAAPTGANGSASFRKLVASDLPVVTVAKGGTGSTNGATGLKNLLAAGGTILSSYQYGTSLPAAGNKGRIFFKKVSS